MKSIAITTVLMVASCHLFAQTNSDKFYFANLQKELTEVSMEEAGSHFLGDDIAKKVYLLKQDYTWLEEDNPIRPGATLITEKPSIYIKIRKLEKYYKKEIKSGNISETEAIDQFSRILDIAINIRYQKTEDLENRLNGIKDDNEIVSLFTQQVIIE